MLLSLGIVSVLNYASLIVHVATHLEQEPLLANDLNKKFLIPASIFLLIVNALFKILNDIFTKETELIVVDIPCLLLWITVLTDYTRKWTVYNCKIAQKKGVRVMKIQLASFVIQNWYFTQRNLRMLWVLHGVQGMLLVLLGLGLAHQRMILFEWEDDVIQDRYK
jgi:hypothetical protein